MDRIGQKSAEWIDLAAKYASYQDRLRELGIEVYRHQHSIKIDDGVDKWRYESRLGGAPTITLETRLDRPFWDIGALAGHLHDMTKNPIEDYSRIERRQYESPLSDQS